MSVLKLTKPVMIDGEEKTEISYDLEGLTGAAIEQAAKALSRHKIVVTTVELDPNYHLALFAIAAGIAYEDAQRMGAKDANQAVVAVRGFFLNDTEDSSESTMSEG